MIVSLNVLTNKLIDYYKGSTNVISETARFFVIVRNRIQIAIIRIVTVGSGFCNNYVFIISDILRIHFKIIMYASHYKY